MRAYEYELGPTGAVDFNGCPTSEDQAMVEQMFKGRIRLLRELIKESRTSG